MSSNVKILYEDLLKSLPRSYAESGELLSKVGKTLYRDYDAELYVPVAAKDDQFRKYAIALR